MPAPSGPVSKQALAAAWAISRIGSQDYYNLCQRFLENAYGTSGQYGAAKIASNALVTTRNLDELQPGDPVFFRPDASNGNAGHAGVYIGGGKMVSATYAGVKEDKILDGGYWQNLFVGGGRAPEKWRGVPANDDLIRGAANLADRGLQQAGNVQGAARARTEGNLLTAAPYAEHIFAASARHGVPVNILAAKLHVESGGNPNAVSGAGAQGLMQFMPATARGMGIDPLDPAQAIDGGARYLRQLYDNPKSKGDWRWAIQAYNAGPAGNFNNAETRAHIQKVEAAATTIGDSLSSAGPSTSSTPQPPREPVDVASRRAKIEMIRQGPLGDQYDVTAALRPYEGNWLQQQATRTQENNPYITVTDKSTGRARTVNIDQLLAQPGAMPDNDTIQRIAQIDNAPQKNETWEAFKAQFNRPPPPPPTAPGSGSSFGNDYGMQPGGAPPSPPAQQASGDASSIPAGGQGGIVDDTAPPVGPQMGPPGPPTPGASGGGDGGQEQGMYDPSEYTQDWARVVAGNANDIRRNINALKKQRDGLPAGSAEQFMISRQIEAQEKSWQEAAALLVRAKGETEKPPDVVAGTAGGPNISVWKKQPDGSYKIESVPDPGYNPNPSPDRTSADATSRYASDQSLAASQGDNAASRYSADQSLEGTRLTTGASRYATDRGRENTLDTINSTQRIADLTNNTNRITTAITSAVNQRAQDIQAQIENRKLTFQEGQEQFNQWYKQNVEAPMAILQQQRETARYQIEQQNALTSRASAESQHALGMANAGTSAYQAASQAYGQALDRSVPAGWNQQFNNNLNAAGTGQTQFSGGGTPVSESMDEFATRKVAEALKGVSPYATMIANAQQATGINPADPMSGGAMNDLTNAAASTATNALQTPFQMPALPAWDVPPPVNIGGMAAAGSGGGWGQALRPEEINNMIGGYQP